MRKTAKNSTFDEYRMACKCHSTNGYNENDIDLCMRLNHWCLEISTGFQGREICPRMRRWRRIHKND